MRLRSPVGLHVLAALFAIVAVVVLSQQALHGTSLDLTASLTETNMKADIGVEHTGPLSLSLSLSKGEGSGIADIGQYGEETIAVSVPADWQRREVRGAPLASVTADPSTFGFTRWHLPPGTVISFGVPVSPASLILHNPSGVPLKVTLTRVDLEAQSVERDVVLVQESSVQLW
ncbi:MAG: hypothetical protein PHI23_04060 [Candidatus Peribacteraceae bacterium]|nr:hypothetical protein [Candidatus Peribacteraceae bacterium]